MRFILFLVLIPALVFAQGNKFSSDLKIARHLGGYYYEHPESSLPLFGSVAKKMKGDTIIVELDLRRSKNGTSTSCMMKPWTAPPTEREN